MSFLNVAVNNLSKNYTIPMEIDFPRYNTKCSGENKILRGIFSVLFDFVIYLENLDYILDSDFSLTT